MELGGGEGAFGVKDLNENDNIRKNKEENK